MYRKGDNFDSVWEFSRMIWRGAYNRIILKTQQHQTDLYSGFYNT